MGALQGHIVSPGGVARTQGERFDFDLSRTESLKKNPTLLPKSGYPWPLAYGSRATCLVSPLPLPRETPPLPPRNLGY